MRQTLYTIFGMIGFMSALGFARGIKGPATFALYVGGAAVAVVGTGVLLTLDLIERTRPKKKRRRRRSRDLE